MSSIEREERNSKMAHCNELHTSKHEVRWSMITHAWPEKMYMLLIPVSKSNDHITLLTTTTQKRARKGHVSRLTSRCIQCIDIGTKRRPRWCATYKKGRQIHIAAF